jgi:hypothetical protein
MFYLIIERFCNSISGALFWMLIIGMIGGTLVWIYKTVSNDIVKDIEILGKKKKNEEEG